MTLHVREATPDDRPDVRQVLDAAMLRVRADLDERIAAGDVLVASESDDAPILGALVIVPAERGAFVAGDGGAHVDAVAVRRARRGQGIGSALVRAAIERQPRLTAEFEADVRPFYESLGFDIEAIPETDDRFRGCLE